MKTQDEINQNNELICLFMGGVEIAPAHYFIEEKKTYFLPDEIKYHESWDWLMPVVRKIITEWETHPQPYGKFLGFEQPIRSHLMPVNWLLNIGLMYREVVAFIKWRNLHGKV